MSVKKSNILYTLFLLGLVPIIIIVFASFVTANSDKDHTIDYNKIFKIEDYNIKINNAILVTDTNQFYFTFNYKTTIASTEWTEPEIISVKTGYNNNKEFYIEHEADMAKYFVAVDMEKKFEFVQINVVTTTPEKKLPDTVDEFGDTVEGKLIEAKRSEQYIRIDYDDILKLTTDQKAKNSTTKAASLDPVDEIVETGVVVTTTAPTLTSEIPPEQSMLTASVSQSSKQETVSDTKQTTAQAVTAPPVTVTQTQTVTQKTQSATQTQSSKDTTKQTSKDTSKQTSKDTSKQTTKDTTKQTTKNTTKQTTKDTTEQATSEITETKPPVTKTSETVTSDLNIIHVYSIKLETGFAQNNVLLSAGKSATVKAIVLPDNATDRSVTWKSNKPEIATVDSNGKITAVSPGKAIISCYTNDKNLQAACMVTVV